MSFNESAIKPNKTELKFTLPKLTESIIFTNNFNEEINYEVILRSGPFTCILNCNRPLKGIIDANSSKEFIFTLCDNIIEIVKIYHPTIKIYFYHKSNEISYEIRWSLQQYYTETGTMTNFDTATTSKKQKSMISIEEKSKKQETQIKKLGEISLINKIKLIPEILTLKSNSLIELLIYNENVFDILLQIEKRNFFTINLNGGILQAGQYMKIIFNVNNQYPDNGLPIIMKVTNYSNQTQFANKEIVWFYENLDDINQRNACTTTQSNAFTNFINFDNIYRYGTTNFRLMIQLNFLLVLINFLTTIYILFFNPIDQHWVALMKERNLNHIIEKCSSWYQLDNLSFNQTCRNVF